MPCLVSASHDNVGDRHVHTLGHCHLYRSWLSSEQLHFPRGQCQNFDCLLNSTDYDKRTRPMPGRPNVLVEVEIELKKIRKM